MYYNYMKNFNDPAKHSDFKKSKEEATDNVFLILFIDYKVNGINWRYIIDVQNNR